MDACWNDTGFHLVLREKCRANYLMAIVWLCHCLGMLTLNGNGYVFITFAIKWSDSVHHGHHTIVIENGTPHTWYFHLATSHATVSGLDFRFVLLQILCFPSTMIAMLPFRTIFFLYIFTIVRWFFRCYLMKFAIVYSCYLIWVRMRCRDHSKINIHARPVLLVFVVLVALIRTHTAVVLEKWFQSIHSANTVDGS